MHRFSESFDGDAADGPDGNSYVGEGTSSMAAESRGVRRWDELYHLLRGMLGYFVELMAEVACGAVEGVEVTLPRRLLLSGTPASSVVRFSVPDGLAFAATAVASHGGTGDFGWLFDVARRAIACDPKTGLQRVLGQIVSNPVDLAGADQH
jgi:hypothetical protein